MFEKVLQVIFGLVLVIILWQLVVVHKATTGVSDENAYLRGQIDDLRREMRAGAWPHKATPPGPTRTPVGRPGQALDETDYPFDADPLVEGTVTTPATSSDEAKAKEQQEALDHIHSQIQDLLDSVDAIEADLETIDAAMLEFRTGAQTTTTDLATLVQEVARLSAAVERLTGENR
jgi:hypothetical protein